MNPLYMLQMTLAPRALLAFAREQGIDDGRGELDTGYLGHAWLRAAFGERTPGPWRLFMDDRPRQRPARLLAYGSEPAESLAEHLACHALPGVQAVCPPEAVLGKPLPEHWPAPRKYQFEVLCCPIGRKNGSGIEKDQYLLALDRDPDTDPDRAQIYTEWCQRQLGRTEGILVDAVSLEGFRLFQALRKTHGQRRRSHRQIRPRALLRGRITTSEPGAIPKLLKQGIGRHRAFGFGMILLRPTQ